MRKPDCDPGAKFGSWTVTGDAPYDPKNPKVRRVRCECACGEKRIVFVNGLRSGLTTSCGHDHPNVQHGATKKENKGTEYGRLFNVWRSMIDRCECPTHHAYHRYGGRGITVCLAWHDFATCIADMGARPSGESIERIDNNAGYSPGNCRWASRKEQSFNRENTIYVEYEGVQVSLAELSDRFGVPHGNVLSRVERGWDVHRALTEPIRSCARGGERQPTVRGVYKYAGNLLTLKELAEHTSFSYNTLYNRIVRSKQTVDQALSKPSRSKRVQHQGTN